MSRPDAGDPAPEVPARDLVRWGTVKAHRRLEAWTGTIDGTRPTLLFVLHNSGGGTFRYAKAVARLVRGSANVIYGIGIRERRLILCRNPDFRDAGISFNLPAEIPDLISTAGRLGVARVNVVHALGFEARLAELLLAWGLPYDITLTDYHLAAATPHLLDENHRYIGDASRTTTRRDRPGFVDNAERIVACSRHLAGSMSEFWPDLDIVASAPIDAPAAGYAGAVWRPVWPGAPLRVLLVNASLRLKGARTFARAAEIAMANGLPLEFHLVLDATHPQRVTVDLANVIQYDSDQHQLSSAVASVVSQAKPHLAWFPFEAPETYSFVLSDALENRLPILASAIGAIPERLHGRRLTWLMPPDTSPEGWLAMLTRLRTFRLCLRPVRKPIGDLPPARPFFPDVFMEPLRGWRQHPLP